jgi:serine protease Do
VRYIDNLKWKKSWLALALAPALIAVVAAAALPTHAKDDKGLERSAATGYAKSLSHAFREAAKEVQPSVVLIKADPVVPVQWKGRGETPNGPSMEKRFGQIPHGMPFGNMPELRRFFEEMPRTPRRGGSGIGSGVIIDESGIILTNNHVVEGRNEITVRLHDGREFKAVEVKSDPNTDMAVLRIEGAEDLKAAALGDSDQVEIGDWVLALGHPFGLEGTVTAGIVSAKGRGIGMPTRASFIQTDAAINPGNSGGPLVNLDGEVIGINTAISSSSGGNQGIGFAVPVNLAKWVSRQLIDNGNVQRARMGVMIQPLTHELAEEFGLDAPEGVLVADVVADTPAAKAGLEPGDVIVEYAGQAVSSPRELQAVVERSEIGTKQQMVVMRDGKRRTLEVIPAEQPADAQHAASSRSGMGQGEPSRFEKLGLEVETLTSEVAKHLNVKADHGVVITDVQSGGFADRAGLAAGMVIVEANRKPVKTVDDLRKVLDETDDHDTLLLIRSEHGSRFVVLHTDG